MDIWGIGSVSLNDLEKFRNGLKISPKQSSSDSSDKEKKKAPKTFYVNIESYLKDLYPSSRNKKHSTKKSGNSKYISPPTDLPLTTILNLLIDK